MLHCKTSSTDIFNNKRDAEYVLMWGTLLGPLKGTLGDPFLKKGTIRGPFETKKGTQYFNIKSHGKICNL